MKTISLADLDLMAKHRPAGYVADVLSRATSVTETHYTITEEAWGELAAKYRAARALPLGQIPDDFNPEQERRRMQQGGCCGGASKEAG